LKSRETTRRMAAIRFGNKTISLPRNRMARMVIGGGFVLGGTLGFLPVLGFWMVPIGLIVLSHDFPRVRRFRRQSEVAILRRWARLRGKGSSPAG
jgi:purine-cytosine permease-like protein